MRGRRTAPRWATFVAKVVDATSSGVFLEFAILLLSILIPNQRLNDRSNTMLAVTQTEPLVGNETPQRIGVLKYDRTVTVQRRQGSALKRTR